MAGIAIPLKARTCSSVAITVLSPVWGTPVSSIDDYHLHDANKIIVGLGKKLSPTFVVERKDENFDGSIFRSSLVIRLSSEVRYGIRIAITLDRDCFETQLYNCKDDCVVSNKRYQSVKIPVHDEAGVKLHVSNCVPRVADF